MANAFPNMDLLDLADMSDDDASWDANSILQGTLLDPVFTSTPIPTAPAAAAASATGVGVGTSTSPSPRAGPSGINTSVGAGTPLTTPRRPVFSRGKRIPTGRPAPSVSVGKQPRNRSTPRGRGRGRSVATSARQASTSRTLRARGGQSQNNTRGRMTQAELRRQLQLLSQDQV